MKAFSIIKPSDIVFASALPMSELTFRKQCAKPTTVHEYHTKYLSSWLRYKLGIGDYLKWCLHEQKCLGVKVVPEVTFRQWGELFDGHSKIVVLLAHWQECGKNDSCAIEFADGFRAGRDILGAIPEEFDGLLDLCVCHPTSFVKMLEMERPRMRVLYKKFKAPPDIWLMLYNATILKIAATPLDYLTAIEHTMREALTWRWDDPEYPTP